MCPQGKNSRLPFLTQLSQRWLEENYELKNMEHYHGTGAFNLTKYNTWDAILLDMLHKPKKTIIIQAKRRGNGHGGWTSSHKNPHLPDRFVEFEIDIDPPALVQRILSVRQQIAQDWIHDLNTLIMANDMILDSYFETQYKNTTTSASSRNATAQLASLNSTANLTDTTVTTESTFLGFYDTPEVDTSTTVSPSTIATTMGPTHAFERKAMMLLNNHIESGNAAGSPQRKGNFDLLLLLATQESLHRVLRGYSKQMDKKSSRALFEWLRQFYIDRIHYFDGNQEVYGRADDFLDQLLLSPPSITSSDQLVDPLKIAEDIIEERSKVCSEWKEIMESSPREQMDLQRDILLLRMGAQLQQEQDEKKKDELKTTLSVSEEDSTTLGAFE